MVMMQMATSIFDLLHDDIPPSNVKLFGPNFDKPLSLKIRLNMLLETLIGLEFLHVNNVLHLDVKSMNLMITERLYIRYNLSPSPCFFTLLVRPLYISIIYIYIFMFCPPNTNVSPPITCFLIYSYSLRAFLVVK